MRKFDLFIALLFIISSVNAADYTSVGDGNFYDINTWGGGLTLEDIRSGNNNFTISIGHNITLNDSVNVNKLTVNGALLLGDGSKDCSLVVKSDFKVLGSAMVSSYTATHNLYVYGNFVSDGNINFRNNGREVVNVYLSGNCALSGSQEPVFNNLNIIGGTITANRSLDIWGNFLIKSGAVFNAGDFEHKLAGSLINLGTFSCNNSKFIFKGTLVQSVSNNITMYDVDMNGGGIVSLSGSLTVSNDIIISNNTKVIVSTNQVFKGDFFVESGSEFKASAGNVYFNGGNQEIKLEGDVLFQRLSFAGLSIKTVFGSLDCENYTSFRDGVTVKDGMANQTHYLAGIVVYDNSNAQFEGVLNFNKTTSNIFKSGGGEISLGSAEIIINAPVFITNNTILNTSNDVTVNTVYIVINEGSELKGTSRFTVKGGTSLYVRGNNNFPEGFSTIELENKSWVRYDANINQTIRGNLDYGYLYAYQKTKTVDGPLNIRQNLYVYANTTSDDSTVLDLGNFDHHLKGSLCDNYNAKFPDRKSFIRVSGGKFYLDGESINQKVYCRTNAPKAYDFNDFIITNPNPTIIKTVTFIGYDYDNINNTQTNMVVKGDFSATNSTTNSSLSLCIDFNTFILSNKADGTNNSTGGTGAITIGDNVKFFTSGKSSFQRSVKTFNNKNFHKNSTVRFDGAESQNLSSNMAYGNLEFAGGGFKSIVSSVLIQGDVRTVSGTPIFNISSSFWPVTVNIQGDWYLSRNQVKYQDNKPIVLNFSGENQYIRHSTKFPNVIFSGSGTKNTIGNIDINGNLNIQSGVIVNSSGSNINLSGNFINSSNGKFINTNASLIFDGSEKQTIIVQAGNATEFETIIINKEADEVQLLSNIDINRGLYLTKNKGDLNIQNYTVTIGGDFYSREGTVFKWTDGAKLHFNGSSEDQLIRNYNEATIYPDMEFSGSGIKRLYEKAFHVEGDFIMQNASVRGGLFNIYVSGNWVNNGGSYGHYWATIFDGTDQEIDATDFEDVIFSGTGTKRLKGHINVGGFLTIEENATLDVSPDNGVNSFNITVEEDWNNNSYNEDSTSTGHFIPREGTVAFVGEHSNIYTGNNIDENGIGILGKSFYNLVINNASINYWTRLYPISDPKNAKIKVPNDLKVENDFTLNNGIFYSYWNHLHVGGNFKNIGGNLDLLERYSQAPVLYLEGSENRIYAFDPGVVHRLGRVEITQGGTYKMVRDLTMSRSNLVTKLLITNGKLDLNHNILKINANTGDVVIGNDGELVVNDSAQLQMYSGRFIYNSGVFKLVGTEKNKAFLSSISGYFKFIQDEGVFHAKHYSINNTAGDGFLFNGGAIDETNNFSDGSFSGGSGNAYLTFPEGGVSIASSVEVNNVIFNNGPEHNVSRALNNTGTESISFINSSGSLSGENYDDDDGNKINWSYPGSKFWDGEANDGLWHTAQNWVGDVVPIETDNVILDHSNVSGAYEVVIDQNAAIKGMSIGSGGDIKLILNGANFSAKGNLTINNGGALIQTGVTDTLFVAESFSNDGNFDPNSSVVVFNPIGGVHSISNAIPFNDVVIAGIGGEIVLSSNIFVNGNLSIESGTLKATNRNIDLKGNWFVGSGTFDGGSGTVLFSRNDVIPQTISGGKFFSVKILNSSHKVLNNLIYLDGDMTIESGSHLNGGDHYIFVGRHWYNKEGVGGFSQSGNGTVVFNSKGTISIGNFNNSSETKSTTFNNLILKGRGSKCIANSITVNGNFTNKVSAGVFLYSRGYNPTEIIGTDNGSFFMNQGVMYLVGENSFPQGFGTYSLTGGIIDYYSNNNQIIYGGPDVEYYDLRVRRVNTYLDANINGGEVTKKTANGNLKVSHSIWVSDTCTVLNMAGYDLYLQGTLGLSTQKQGYPPQIEWGEGALIHEGATVTLDSDIIYYNNILKRGSGWMKLSVDVEVNGNVSIFDDCGMSMGKFTMNCISPDKTLSMGANTLIYSAVADTSATTKYAFPTGFKSYNIDPTNNYWLLGKYDQAILPNVTYGGVNIGNDVVKTVTLHGDLDVDGDFRMVVDGIVLDDQGYDIYLGGASNDIRNYNPTSTVIFDGSGHQRIYAGGVFDVVNLNNVIFKGGGTTYLYEPNYTITGNLNIENGDTLYSNRNINFSGSIFTNEGVFKHIGEVFTFDGVNQTISPGINDFYNVYFSNKGTKTFIDKGINVNNNMKVYGAVVDDSVSGSYYDTVIVDFGNLTHYIGSSGVYVHTNSSWLTQNANIYFDRAGNQIIPPIELNNVFFANRGGKYLSDVLYANDINIESNVNLISSREPSMPNDIFCRGSWLNYGGYIGRKNKVYFEAANTDNGMIKTNGSSFYEVLFNQESTIQRTYLMQDNFQINEELIVGNGATLKVNGNNLQLGNDDINVDSYPDGEEHTIQQGGCIEVDAGGSILFDQNDMYPLLTVEGTLKVVGEFGNNATLGRLSGGTRRGTKIVVKSGADVHFNYYAVESLHYDGLVLENGAIINSVNNFSNGIWNGIYGGNSYRELNDANIVRNKFIYLNLQNDVSGTLSINNVTFNHSATPKIGTHYNVSRPSSTSGVISFTGTSRGALSGEIYEDDPYQIANGAPGLIEWPPISQLTWNGSVSSDWFNPKNWTPIGVPDNTQDVVIPLITDGGENPVIVAEGAQCKDLYLTNGVLVIENGVQNFTVSGDFIMQSDAIFAISGNSVVNLTGDWDIAPDALFSSGESEVNFTSVIGSTIVNSRNAAFYNVRFSGGATFYIVGKELHIENDIFIENGSVVPNTNNYTYYIGGNYSKTGGVFSISPNVGFFEFNGTSEQHIVGGQFSRLRINNQDYPVLLDDPAFVNWYSTDVNYPAFEVKAGATFVANGEFTINGNVDIEEDGIFNDGDLTHIFKGRCWIGKGGYEGNGTIRSIGGTQNIYQSNFNNLVLENDAESQSWKTLLGTVTVRNNVEVNCYGLNLKDQHIINSSGNGTFKIGFNPGKVRVYVRGEDNYPSGFDSYICASDSYVFYDALFDQKIRGGQYGRLYLRNNSTKSLAGNIDVDNNLYLYGGEVVFDANGFDISLAGHWYNQEGGTFLPRGGEVKFDGESNQMLYLQSTGTNNFNKITVEKSDATTFVRVIYNDITIKNKLWVRKGGFYCYDGYNVTLMSDMEATDEGFFSNTGTYILANPISNGESIIRFNGSEIRNLIIDGSATFKAADDLFISNLFTLESGIFDGNGKNITIGNHSNVANISSLYKIGVGGSLRLGSLTTFNILSEGRVEVIGSPTAPAIVKGRAANHYYYFNVEENGTIAASDYIFENMAGAGVYVKYGAIIDIEHNFSNGSFLRPTSGGICLRIENTQNFTYSDYIENVRFPNNPGNGTKNVAKLVTTTGVLDFYSASGDLAGVDYENDNYNLINWPGVNTIIWKGGAHINSDKDKQDWNIAKNWEPARVPLNLDNVIIPDDVANFPIFNIDKVEGYTDTIKSIQNNNILAINADPSLNEVSLVVLEEFKNNGDVKLSGIKAALYIEGFFTNTRTGILSTDASASGKMRFVGNKPSALNGKLIADWLSLEIDKSSLVQISNNLSVKNVNIENGTLQFINNNKTLVVYENFINKGDVNMAQSTLKLSGRGLDDYVFEPNTSLYYNIQVTNGKYNLASPNLDVSHFMTVHSGASFKLNGNSFSYGNGTASGSLLVEGLLEMNSDSKLHLRPDADVSVGGIFKAIGAENHEAIITNDGSGRYEFVVVDGGTLNCNNYIFEYLNPNGLTFLSGSTINNLSNGKFSQGASGGRYIDFQNNLSTPNDTLLIQSIQFDEGVLHNAKRKSSLTTGIINFKDAMGLAAGYYFEDDDSNMVTGAIIWSYTLPTVVWTGLIDEKWDVQQNWIPQSVPTETATAIIKNGAPNYPVLNSISPGNMATCKTIIIENEASVTLSDGESLNVLKDINIYGNSLEKGRLIVTSGSNSTITVGGNWSNGGVFDHGSSSTVKFISADNMDINTGGQPFYNLTFDSKNSTVPATFSTQSDLNIDGSLTIENGVFDVSSSNHKLYVSGNFVNNDTFNHGKGQVFLNGNVSQVIQNSNSDFYILNLEGDGSKTLTSNIAVVKKLENSSAFNTGIYDVLLKGDLINNKTFTANSGIVYLKGTSSQFIKGKSFFINNLIVNNSGSGTAVKLEAPITVGASLKLTDGIVETSTSNLVILNDGAVLTGGNPQSYINGSLQKNGNQDFIFPIGSGNKYAPLGISNMSDLGNFIATYSSGGYNSNQLGAQINHVSTVEHWHLNRKSGTATPLVTLYWNDGIYSEVTDIEPLVGAYYLPGTGWTNKGQSAFSGDISVGSITTEIAFSQTGYFTLGWAYIDLIWTGSVDTNWNTTGNWNLNQLPSKTTNVHIPGTGISNYPVLSNYGSSFDLNIANDASLKISDGVILDAGGNTVIDSAGTIKIGKNAQLYLKGNLTNSGTIDPGQGSTISINGAIEQNISNITAYNLNVSGEKNKILSGTVAVNNDLLVYGDLDLGNSSVVLDGDMNLIGTIKSGIGSFKFNGNKQQNIKGNKQITFNKVEIDNKSATVPQLLLSSNMAVNNQLTFTRGIIAIPDINKELTIATAAICSGGNANSFVDGYVRKIGTSDFIFPTGAGEHWARIGISDMGSGAGDFKARYFYEDYGVTASMSESIDHVSILEYWDLDRPSGTEEPKVRLYWQDTALSAIDDPALLLVAHYSNGNWIDMGNSESSWDDSGLGVPGFVKSDVKFTSFSPITFASKSADFNPLPVEITDFNVEVLNNNEVLATWTTLSENNNSHFLLERSRDGLMFEQVGRLDGAGNSKIAVHYSFSDVDPYKGVSYYRLRQVDFDGVEDLFPIKSVFIDQSGNVSDVLLFPNPVHNNQCFIKLVGQQESTFDMVILSSTGNTIVSKSISVESGKYAITKYISGLPSGIYTVILYNKRGNWVKKLVIE